MRIVVPTDFSDLAKIALQYAVFFARQAKAELLLLHVLPNIGPSLGTTPTNELIKEMHEGAAQDLEKLVSEVAKENVPVTYEITHGAAVEEILQYFIQMHNIDLVIMGSRGASGLKKMLLGSNTVGVINQCNVPVIAVPECAEIGPIEKLVYACDLEHTAKEVMLLVPFAKALGAELIIAHVPTPDDPQKAELQTHVEQLKAETGYPNISLALIEGKDVVKTLEAYTDEEKKELLVMFTHKYNFFEQLWGKSITREIAWHSKTAMLVINNR